MGEMAKSVYIETTVASYFTARPSRDVVTAGRQEATRELWPKLVSEYDGYVSVLVREEAGKGDKEQAALRLQAIEVMMVRQLVENAGYRCPEICSPDELLEAVR